MSGLARTFFTKARAVSDWTFKAMADFSWSEILRSFDTPDHPSQTKMPTSEFELGFRLRCGPTPHARPAGVSNKSNWTRATAHVGPADMRFAGTRSRSLSSSERRF